MIGHLSWRQSSNSLELTALSSLQSADYVVSLFVLFYCYLIAEKPLGEARHWSDDTVFEGRAFYQAAHNPGRLVINSVSIYDQTLYKCRVDFKVQPTTISQVQLNVNSKFVYLNICHGKSCQHTNDQCTLQIIIFLREEQQHWFILVSDMHLLNHKLLIRKLYLFGFNFLNMIQIIQPLLENL